MKKGKVWLVGAGPGDPSLLTLKAKELLDEADVIVYDRLVGDGILAMLPANAKKINVGKEGGSHPVPQKEIEAILVREALPGNRVVRLKGGDPFVFGRGGEEIEELLKHDIPYEVIPGVTSAIAAPEAAGIPVTHRGLSKSLHIITAHTKDGKIPKADCEVLAKLEGTLVFLMGVTAIPDICTYLIKYGKDENTPVAAVHSGTTAGQRRICGTLRNFPELAKAEKLTPPSVVIVGEVAALGEKFAWKEKLSLYGKKIAVTRPRKRSGKLSKMLRDRGAEVLELPAIKTETIMQKLPDMTCYDWLCFTSPTGVEAFFELLRYNKKDIRSTGQSKIAAIGSATKTALEEKGLAVDLVPEVYDGISLAHELVKKAKGEKILLLRAENGSQEITKELEAGGMDFTELHTYKTEYVNSDIKINSLDMVLFTSASTVRGFVHAYPSLKPKTVCCIGKQTAEEAEKAGFTQIRIAKIATLEELVKVAEEK